MKTARRDADHSERLLVHLHRSPDDARIVMKMAVPKTVREHNVRRAIRTAFVRSMQEAPEVGLDLQNVEVISAHAGNGNARRPIARVEPHLADAVRGERFETRIAT